MRKPRHKEVRELAQGLIVSGTTLIENTNLSEGIKSMAYNATLFCVKVIL